MLCLFLSGWGSMQAVLAQDLKEMEKNLSAINEELSQKTKEYSWQLAAAYADYCEANNKYISWNDLPYLQQVVEYERPASLETYRLEHKASKEELDKFLNTYKEYKDLVKKQKEAVTKEEKDAVSTAFSAFWKKLRSEENAYKDYGCGHLGIGGLHIVGRHERNVHAAADVDAEADVRCALDVDILGVAVGIAHTKDGRQGEQHDQNCHDEQRP